MNTNKLKRQQSASIEYLIPYVGIDIGGTLAKLCFALQKGSPVDFKHIEHLAIRSYSDFDVFFQTFQTNDVESLIDFIDQLNMNFITKKFYITGGGAHKFEELFQKRLKVEIIKVQEFESLRMGFLLLDQLTPNDTVFTYSKQKGQQYIVKNKSLFPFLLVNVGSGVSIIKFLDEGTIQRVNGTSIGGGFFLGLAHLLTGENNFNSLLDISNKGDNQNLDLYVSDIFGQSNAPKDIHGDALCVSMGKMTQKLKEGQDVNKQDIVKSLLLMTSFNLSQIAFNQAKLEGIQNIIFAGNFVRNHPDTMDCIDHAIDYFNQAQSKQNQNQAFFVKHDGFIGALGSFYDAFNKKVHESNV
ncbi:pantothenate kinase, putative [Ichthyophthirius multifiliis]|uniref:Pantothenate kinase, putative n=1 Tax=Ichthyophthirius multifiliis TaxID=5932 RepID=G0R2H7_ICHMU|nr:pantothenate kinase, putative [Ichthyophthirius multifiliis]EGR28327.1 pantothenate kinase, putative [Ichthyophthirius multifiliis]|eukprot:XP_004027672.1 pantothenate kinase, putative [Ichthyophthirius multifiliis]